MPKLLTLLLIFSFVLNQVGVVFRFDGVKLYLFDVLALVFALVGFFYFYAPKKFFLSKGFILYVFFIGWALISLIYNLYILSFGEFLTAGFYLFRVFVYLVDAVVILNFVKIKAVSKEFVLQGFLVSGVLLFVFGLLQLWFFPDFVEAGFYDLGWDPHKFRMASTFFDPNFVGTYLCLCFAVCLLLLENFHKDLKLVWSKSVLWTFGACFIVGVILTFSRSAWLMFSVIFLFYAWAKNKNLLVIFFVILFGVYFLVPRIQTRLSGVTDPTDSAYFRFISWQNTVQIAKDNWFWGVGFNAFKHAQLRYGTLELSQVEVNSASGADSSVLLVYATTGIIGLLLYGNAFLYPVFMTAFIKQRFFVFGVIFGLLINSQFINSLFFPPVLFFYLVVFFIFDF